MAKAQVKLSYSQYSDTWLDSNGKTILESMDGNLNFPETSPTFADISTTFNAYVVALGKARSGDKEAIAVKKDLKAELVDKFELLAFDVNNQALGDAAKLRSTKMPMYKERVNRVPLQEPVDVYIMHGSQSGEIIMGVGKTPGARMFMFEHTVDIANEDSWISRGTTSRKYTFKKLVPGTKLWFRVVAVGSNDQQAISKPLEATII